MECLSTAEEFVSTPFDFLVVGGGTAGLVVATRLSENPNVTVGVIEAGPPSLSDQRVANPAQMGSTINSELDWGFRTTPQAGFEGRSLPWPRGRMLGGTSGMNFMVWNRAAREDFDGWEKLGNPGWGWDALNQYFKRSEQLALPVQDLNQGAKTIAAVGDHGLEGPVQTTIQTGLTATHRNWFETLEQLGIRTNRSHFGGSNIGACASVLSVNPADQTRSYSESTYLAQGANRPNLKVLTDAHAGKVVLEAKGEKQLASGVEVTVNGSKLTVQCRKEVILCAGAVGSPQILELSGIGNPDVLSLAGIEVKVDNPNVGENLQEHMMSMTVYETRSDAVRPPEASIPDCLAYFPVSTFLPDTSALASKAEKFAMAHPKGSRDQVLNQVLKEQFSTASCLGQVEFVFGYGNYSVAYQGEADKTYATMMQVLQYPYSRGSIHIDAAQAAQGKVNIDPKYFQGEGEIDFEVMVEAQRFGDRVHQTAPMSNTLRRRVYPPASADLDWAQWVRENTATDWHPVGTCSMLPRQSGGVVDPNLKVYGTWNLRVVDASIFPTQISAHIQASIYGVAEKAADVIKTSGQDSRRAHL